MTNFLLVVFVFVIGFGWGAASMAIPIIKNLNEIIEWNLAITEILNDVAKEYRAVLGTAAHVNENCGGVIEATNKVVESVDNLIKELGNEI